MKKVLLLVLFLLSGTFRAQSAGHPRLLMSRAEARQIRAALGHTPLLDRTFSQIRAEVDSAIARGIEVPPPGEGGSYEHERHKQNYRDMQKAGLLFVITGQEKYARFVRDILRQYAAMYPKLGPSPYARKQAPGKIFHQMLNETVWLVYTSQAYDCIYDWLTPADRKLFETNIFRPMAQWFTGRNAREFNRIHNHGTWAVAAVGMLGYVLDDPNLVQMALYGTNKDGKGGFLKQLERLFSPDGYYMEGPYYVRYALRPFFFFAEAIERNQPELHIYAYRDSILKKAYYAAVETIFPNGVFPPINDASRSMNVKAPGVVIANDLVYWRYGADPNLLAIAKLQGTVQLSAAGLALARDYGDGSRVPPLCWKSVEFRDGYDGRRGGLGILRLGTEEDQSMLLMKYGVHGGGHGHFDQLHFIFFEQGREIIPDYGFCRWINVEPKFGGRYLPENTTYAKTTVAHNTVVVDEKVQNNGDRRWAEKVWGQRHFFDASNSDVQVMSARADSFYAGVRMQRTMFLVHDRRLRFPVVVDIFRLTSSQAHTYDYPIHYSGQPILMEFPYTAHTKGLRPLGSGGGYQHLWVEAEGRTDGPVRFTWLDGHRYYTLVSSAFPGTEIFMTRIGAADPNFNLRREPAVLLRRKGRAMVFASVIEPHGYFNEAEERSEDALGEILRVDVLGSSDEGTVVEVTGKGGLNWRFGVTNGPADARAVHRLRFKGKTFTWMGNYFADLNPEAAAKQRKGRE